MFQFLHLFHTISLYVIVIDRVPFSEVVTFGVLFELEDEEEEVEGCDEAGGAGAGATGGADMFPPNMGASVVIGIVATRGMFI